MDLRRRRSCVYGYTGFTFCTGWSNINGDRTENAGRTMGPTARIVLREHTSTAADAAAAGRPYGIVRERKTSYILSALSRYCIIPTATVCNMCTTASAYVKRPDKYVRPVYISLGLVKSVLERKKTKTKKKKT